jgi:hypothetical protein
MVSAVLLFGLMNVILEMVLIGMLPPRLRLRVLGNPHYRNLLHVLFLLANLMSHWGTVVGTMAAVMAFISSVATVRVAMLVFGYITDGRHYHVGWVKYSVEELR